jgi:plastocyanin
MGGKNEKGSGYFLVLLSTFMTFECAGNNKEPTTNEITSPTATPVNTPVAPPGTAKSLEQGKIVDVMIQNFTFNPSSVEVSAGDTVRWTNMDNTEHTVSGNTFTSGLIPKGQNYEFLFAEPGVYNYECSIHPSMKGTVSVVEKK